MNADMPPDALSPLCVATTTVGSEAQAMELARAMVALRLAACAQVEPIRSVYVWDGATCDEPEWRISFKTRPALEPQLRAAVHQRHPYTLPQWVVGGVQGSAAYAAWVDEGTG